MASNPERSLSSLDALIRSVRMGVLPPKRERDYLCDDIGYVRDEFAALLISRKRIKDKSESQAFSPKREDMR